MPILLLHLQEQHLKFQPEYPIFFVLPFVLVFFLLSELFTTSETGDGGRLKVKCAFAREALAPKDYCLYAARSFSSR